jgi:hypothetical protein
MAVFSIIAMIWSQPKCLSVDEWIKSVVNIQNGILYNII